MPSRGFSLNFDFKLEASSQYLVMLLSSNLLGLLNKDLLSRHFNILYEWKYSGVQQ